MTHNDIEGIFNALTTELVSGLDHSRPKSITLVRANHGFLVTATVRVVKTYQNGYDDEPKPRY